MNKWNELKELMNEKRRVYENPTTEYTCGKSAAYEWIVYYMDVLEHKAIHERNPNNDG